MVFTIFWLSVQMKVIPSKICHGAGSQRTADIKHKSLSVRAMAWYGLKNLLRAIHLWWIHNGYASWTSAWHLTLVLVTVVEYP